MESKNKKISSALGALLLMLGAAISPASAADSTQMSQSITGSLGVQITDGSGNPAASPNVLFPSKAFSMLYQTSSSTLGTATERLRITNPSGTTDTWTLSIAATAGPGALWTNGVNQYDFNDATAAATDGADTDGFGGQMVIDPGVATISGVGATATANISKGSSAAFAEGTKNSIDLMSAAAGAQKPGSWDLTGVNVTQTIPAVQATGSYAISMTLTAV